MDKLTPKDRLELFYFLYKEWGIVALPGLYNAIIKAVETGESLPSFTIENSKDL